MNHPTRVRQNYCDHTWKKEPVQDKRLSVGVLMKCEKCQKKIMAPSSREYTSTVLEGKE